MLIAHQRQLAAAQRETAVVAKAQLAQAREGRGDGLAHGDFRQGLEVAFDALHGGVEAVAERFQERRVREAEGVEQELRALGGVVVQVRKAAVVGHFRLRKVGGLRRRAPRQGAVAGDGVEELIVDGRQQDVARELGLQQPHLVRHALPSGRQPQPLRHGRLDGVDVVVQLLAAVLDAVVAGVFVAQGAQFLLELAAVRVDVRLGVGERFLGACRHQARGGVDQRAGALGDAEGGGHLRHAAFVHAPLRLAHAIEREPRH